jgi:hypothetical protein
MNNLQNTKNNYQIKFNNNNKIQQQNRLNGFYFVEKKLEEIYLDRLQHAHPLQRKFSSTLTSSKVSKVES